MSVAWPWIIYDPIHEVISFTDSPCDRLLRELIDTREFQRLRRIKQLGMSELVFPGSSHTRFSHSIGVMQMARKFLKRISEIVGNKLTKEHEIVVLVAALLHDIGHGPFSHAFEKVTKKDHEDWTLDIILTESTEVNRVLRRFNRHLPRSLEVFFIRESQDGEESKHVSRIGKTLLPAKWVIPSYLKQVVSSQLDADRFDYLLRDSHATGAQYGKFDVNWLISHLFLDKDQRLFYLHFKSLHAAEAYIYSRYHMYQTVYFHKTSRAAEVMLKSLLGRYQNALSRAANAAAQNRIVPSTPDRIKKAFSGRMSLDDYLALDDITLWEFIRASQDSPDSVLAELGHGLINRKLFKAIDVSNDNFAVITVFESFAIDALKKMGFDPEWHLRRDSASDTPYKMPYHPLDFPEKQIFVGGPNEEKRELSKASESVAVLAKPMHMIRYFAPSKVRMKLLSCLAQARKKAKK